MKSVGINELMRDLEQDPEIQGDFILLHNVSDVELSLLYKNCLFTVFPSLYEGWGLPIAESLANGKFCIAGTGSSLPEVGDKFCDYIDPWNVPAWTEILKKYILNPSELYERNELIRQQYVSPRWSDTAEPIKRLLQELTA
jgi:glycosyltransferase involved in cell wall biosynthesis